MPRNGSGQYALASGNPVVTGTTISSTTMNSTLSDIATALTGSVAADGQTAMSANLPMGGFKVTGMANGSASTDAAAYGQITAVMPAGALLDYAGTSAPTGFLLCDGSAVSRAVYAALFTAISTTWGAGDGSTTFNVPDFRGRTTIGSGTGSGLTARTVGTQNIGEETHALITAELAAHNHTINITDPTHTHTVSDPTHGHNLIAGGTTARVLTPGIAGGGNFGAGPASTADIVATQGSATGITNVANTTGITAASVNAGSGTAHNNMQPSAVVTKIIKT